MYFNYWDFVNYEYITYLYIFCLFIIFYIGVYIFYKSYLKYKEKCRKNKEIDYIFKEIEFLSSKDKFELLIKKIGLNSSYLISDYLGVKESYVIEKMNNKDYETLVFLILNILKNER